MLERRPVAAAVEREADDEVGLVARQQRHGRLERGVGLREVGGAAALGGVRGGAEAGEQRVLVARLAVRVDREVPLGDGRGLEVRPAAVRAAEELLVVLFF